MAANRRDDESLFTTTWVHVFEQDTPAGAVYRPEDSDIPLSRRPRQRLVLERDGTARILMPGPDDRFIEQAATWKKEGSAVVIRATEANVQMRVMQKSPDSLIVSTGRGETPT